MTNIVKIENQELQVKEFNGQRIVTFKDVAKVHEVDFENVKRNFTNNKHHFIEGQDYYSISRNEFREKFSPKEKLIGNPNVKMILLTESGYLMAVKSLTDDLAWKVQRQLVNCYFKVKEKFSHRSSITFEQMIEIANVIRKTPISSMEYVFEVLKVFVPELEMPERKNQVNIQEELSNYLKEHNLNINQFCNQTGLAKSNV